MIIWWDCPPAASLQIQPERCKQKMKPLTQTKKMTGSAAAACRSQDLLLLTMGKHFFRPEQAKLHDRAVGLLYNKPEEPSMEAAY